MTDRGADPAIGALKVLIALINIERSLASPKRGRRVDTSLLSKSLDALEAAGVRLSIRERSRAVKVLTQPPLRLPPATARAVVRRLKDLGVRAYGRELFALLSGPP
ncbi:MAG: hypothetical protein JOY71_05510 [Acetobacteraceae bacterium]|nr:hypothetical protein [Acetobacteraceae bacterium]MBV8521576.1 hypothetical protein [Acetobacteraceae bacterium]